METLPYEKLEEFEKLRNNPPFPTDFNDENFDFEKENKIDRKKREIPEGKIMFPLIGKKNGYHKMDEKIKQMPTNSKFLGSQIVVD